MNWEFIIISIAVIGGLLLVIGSEKRAEVAKDFTMWFSKQGREDAKIGRYLLHLSVGLLIGIACILVGFWFGFTQFKNMEWYEAGLLFLMGGFLIVAGAWEAYRQYKGGRDANKKYIVPFSWRDVRMSAYGISLGAMVAVKTLQLIFN